MIKLKDILLERIERDAKYQEILFKDEGGKSIAGMNYGLLDFSNIDMTSTGLADKYKAFYRLVGKNPFISNITVSPEHRRKGIAIKLYDDMFKWLKKKGFKKAYSGQTRNSPFVNKIWKKYKSGSTKIAGDEIYWKNL